MMIRTERLILKPLTIDDWSFMLNLLNQPDFIENIGDKNVKTEEQAREHVSQLMKTHQELGFSMLLMTLKPEGQSEESAEEKVGVCGLLKRDFLPYPDLGYAILPQYYRQGYTFEAAQGVLSHYDSFKNIMGITSDSNTGSQNVLLKLGFKSIEPVKGPEDKLFTAFELAR